MFTYLSIFIYMNILIFINVWILYMIYPYMYEHQKIWSVHVYIYSYINDSKGKCCILNQQCHPPWGLGFVRGQIVAPRVSQSRHQGCGTAAAREDFPVKQHLNGPEIEAHLRLGAGPSRLLIFWVLRRDSLPSNDLNSTLLVSFACFIWWGGSLTTSHQNELSLKYDTFKVTYTSISE